MRVGYLLGRPNSLEGRERWEVGGEGRGVRGGREGGRGGER
jgi:hypothetical protein